jgi:heterodisulfide reductase subunit C2
MPTIETLNTENLDDQFKYEVASEIGGEGILRCMACGTCSSGCPVFGLAEDYNPKRIIRLVLLGARSKVLQSSFIWLCSNCFTCQERCPQEVNVTHIMRAIRNLAIRSGMIPDAIKLQMEMLLKFSRLYEIDDFDNKKRAKAGLPELASDPGEIIRLFEVLTKPI